MTFIGGIATDREYYIKSKFSNGDNCGFIEYEYDKKQKEFLLTERHIIGTGKNLSLSDKKTIATITSTLTNSYSKTYSATSPDKNKTALLINTLQTIKNDNYYRKSTLFMFDGSGKLEWKTTFEMKFARESFVIQNVVVNNDGNVFVVANTYIVKKKRQENQAIQTFMIDEDGLQETATSQKSGVYVTDMALKTLNNGNLFIGGYYSTKPVNAERVLNYFGYDVGDFESEGKFGIILGKNNLNEISFTTIPFKNSVPNGATYKEAYSDEYYTFVRDIIETSDGVITLIGEEYRHDQVNSPLQQQAVPLHKSRNVLIDAFNQNGEVVNSSILFKKQENYGVISGIFANIIDAKDKILVLYNESKKHNLNVNKPISDEYEMKSYEKEGIGVVCEILNGEVGQKTQVMDCSKTKTFLDSFYKISDNTAVITSIKKSNGLFTGTYNGDKYTNILTW
jgi:hypothetical protein